MQLFPIRVLKGDDVLKYIFPSKQKDVQNIINCAKTMPNVLKIIVFGSALTWNCGVQSDLDIAIEHDKKLQFEQIASPFFKNTKGKTDIIDYNDIFDNSLKENIKKGVVIYGRYA